MSRAAAARRPVLVLFTTALLASLAFVLVGCDEGAVSARRTSRAATATPSVEEGDGQTITIKGAEFHPKRLEVEAGTTVLWVNGDGTQHIIRDADDEFYIGVLGPGGAASFTFDNPGRHTYKCSIHPAMKGTLIVD